MAALVQQACRQTRTASYVVPSSRNALQRYQLSGYLEFGSKKIEWLPIADEIFSEEAEAWQAAYGHWMKFNKSWSEIIGRKSLAKRIRKLVDQI